MAGNKIVVKLYKKKKTGKQTCHKKKQHTHIKQNKEKYEKNKKKKNKRLYGYLTAINSTTIKGSLSTHCVTQFVSFSWRFDFIVAFVTAF